MQPEDPLRDEITGMADALLEGRLGPDDTRRLEDLVCTDEAAARIYFHYMHMVGGVLPRFGAQTPGDLIGHEGPAGAAPADAMSETMIMPALRDDPRADGELSIILPPAAAPPARSRVFPVRRYAAAAAIVVAAAVVLGLYWGQGPRAGPAPLATGDPIPTTQPSVISGPAVARAVAIARLTALADAVVDEPGLRRPGAPLLAGDVLQLSRGAVEVTCGKGAVLVVEAPASVRMIDASTVALNRGKLCARVPHTGQRFRVTSSRLSVTDLGTEFGVDVGPDGVAVTHVFQGRVSVAAPGPAQTGTVEARLLERDQTASCPVKGGPIQSVPELTETFTRDITRYAVPLNLHNTGADIAEGQPDPNWQFVHDPKERTMLPRPATVAKAPPIYLPNTTSSRWISTAGKLSAVPVGSYTFRTQFDLTGLDPSTARIVAHVAADDVVQHVRVNGRDVPPPSVDNPKSKYTRFHDFAITEGFVEGTNVVEFDVLNELDKMALRVEWEGTARARVTR